MLFESCLYIVGQATRRWSIPAPVCNPLITNLFARIKIEVSESTRSYIYLSSFHRFRLVIMCWTFEYHYGCCLCFCLSETSFCGQQNTTAHPAPLPMLVRLDKECEVCLKLSTDLKTSTTAIVARGRKRDKIIDNLHAQRKQALQASRRTRAQMQTRADSEKKALMARKRSARRCVTRATKLLWHAQAMLAVEDEV